MITLKKYLDMDAPLPAQLLSPSALESVMLKCYHEALTSIGKNAARVTPGLGVDLQSKLHGLIGRLVLNPTAESLRATETHVETVLEEWGEQTAEHFKAKADEVKDLLITLAKAADSAGNNSQSHSSQFTDIIFRLEQIGDLDDLTQMRSSIVRRVAEFKQSVNKMVQENQKSIAQLQAAVSNYEDKFRTLDHQAYRDPLTLVANRRSIEHRIRTHMGKGEPFCVVMVDLDNFKIVNDIWGHSVGDDLLKQFAKELQLNSRSADLVGRWGGDEFVLVLSCSGLSAKSQIERIQDWAIGRYKTQVSPNKTVEFQLQASIGFADWHPGETIEQVIENADKAMYLQKSAARKKG
jgi:diguanylate cyclase (GGDEF)-like protein